VRKVGRGHWQQDIHANARHRLGNPIGGIALTSSTLIAAA
jgi:hypothetical protein